MREPSLDTRAGGRPLSAGAWGMCRMPKRVQCTVRPAPRGEELFERLWRVAWLAGRACGGRLARAFQARLAAVRGVSAARHGLQQRPKGTAVRQAT